MALPVFTADAQGRLVKNADTRIGLERLVALFEPAEALDKLRTQAAGLPAPAQQELQDLFHRYMQYSQAVQTQFAALPEQEPRVLARQQLDLLSRLRRDHFGADTAQRLFGEEERAARSLLAEPAGQ